VQKKVPINSGMNEEKSKNLEDINEKEMQQLVDNNNNKIQQESNNKLQSMYQHKDKLDIEIEMMRKLMMKVSQRRHTEVKKTVNNRLKMTMQVFINKEGGKRQNQIWDPGKLQTTTTTTRTTSKKIHNIILGSRRTSTSRNS
jgi:response regulator RpfG family c-di-GMP phosphodiesterase